MRTPQYSPVYARLGTLLAHWRHTDTPPHPPTHTTRQQPQPRHKAHTVRVDIEPLIAALPGHYTPGEAAAIERVLREYNGTIPDKQLISEAALALAIHRRGRGTA